MNKIDSLDVNKISEVHLIEIKNGAIFYRKTTDPDPLNFHYPITEDTTFTTKILEKKNEPYCEGKDSGTAYVAYSYKVADGEGKAGEIFKILVTKDIERILDLDKVCEEQGIETEYLKLYETETGRNPELEKELYKLYGEELKNKRLNGVRYRSRKFPTEHCICFYDMLISLEVYMSYSKYSNSEKLGTNPGMKIPETHHLVF